jgi:hypothetical protein
VLVVLCITHVLDGIDVTVVNVALPSFSPETLSWVVNALHRDVQRVAAPSVLARDAGLLMELQKAELDPAEGA